MATDRQIERYSLVDSLDQEFIKLPFQAMREVGSATQTLGGILKVTNRETYMSLDKLANSARTPKGTFRKHLRPLHDYGWIVHAGRQQTRGGRTRRTATIQVTSRAREAAVSSYGFLPCWARCGIRRVGRLPWCARAVLSVVMARLASLKRAAEEQDGWADTDDLVGTIENLGGDERFRFGFKTLQRQTGLARRSIFEAKGILQELGMVHWRGDTGVYGETLTDILAPNWDFQVAVTPASPGHCFLDFERGCKSGR